MDKQTKQPHWIMRGLLTQHTPPAGYNLWPPIQARLCSRTQDAPTVGQPMRPAARFIGRRLALSVVILVLLVGFAVMAFVPTVQAHVKEWIDKQVEIFYFNTTASRVTVGMFFDRDLGFTPYNLAYLPGRKWVSVPSVYHDEELGVDGFKLTMNRGDQFVIFRQHTARPDQGFPHGDSVQVGGAAGVLISGLSGKTEAKIPLDERGEVSPQESGLIVIEPVEYSNAVMLIWQVENIRLEIISNLSKKEVLKIAASLRSAEAGSGGTVIVEP